MDIPNQMFMSHRTSVASVSNLLRKGRFFNLSKNERHRAIYALFKINGENLMYRALWTIRVITEKGDSIIFRWCPRKDPMEAPS